jgi:NAD(P)-dependent dehydrogenase (short-subunit alcohol dehydrogenase family)
MNPAPLSIVTGASRGLGLALTRQLLDQGHRVLAIARRPTELQHPALISWSLDLADAPAAAARLSTWLAEQPQPASATLINNAGVVSNPAPLSKGEMADLSNAIRVGLEAPLLLTAVFLAASERWAPVPRKVVLVSSGLGRRGMAGSASYCAAKAGMDNLARAVALEEAAKPHGARIASLAPGVIDTDMQAQLRNADPALFPERQRFQQLKTGDELDTPDEAAAKMLRKLAAADFGHEPVGDIRGA